MQIANSMGIEVGGADKAAEFAIELTQELGLSSGGEEDEAGLDEAQRVAEGGMPDINLDASTFKHDNPAYQRLLLPVMKELSSLLGLVHTQDIHSSCQRSPQDNS